MSRINLPAPSNPWGVTPAEAVALDATIRHACCKKAAAELGLSPKTIEAQLSSVTQRMQAVNRLQTLLRWDRITRKPEEDSHVCTTGA